MNKQSFIGLMLVVSAVVLVCMLAGTNGGAAEGLFGKALWYLPYVALVGGIRNLVRART